MFLFEHCSIFNMDDDVYKDGDDLGNMVQRYKLSKSIFWGNSSNEGENEKDENQNIVFDIGKFNKLLEKTDAAISADNMDMIIKYYVKTYKYFKKTFCQFFVPFNNQQILSLDQVLDYLHSRDFIKFIFFGLSIPDHPIIQINLLKMLAYLYCPESQHEIYDIDNENFQVILNLAQRPSSCLSDQNSIMNEEQRIDICISALNCIKNIIFTQDDFVKYIEDRQIDEMMEIALRADENPDVVHAAIGVISNFIYAKPDVIDYDVHFDFYSNLLIVNDQPCLESLLGCYFCIKYGQDKNVQKPQQEDDEESIKSFHLSSMKYKVKYSTEICQKSIGSLLIDFLNNVIDPNILIIIYKLIGKALSYVEASVAKEFMTHINWETFTNPLRGEEIEVSNEMNIALRKICNHHQSEVQELFTTGCFQPILDTFITGPFSLKYRTLAIINTIIDCLDVSNIIPLFQNPDFITIVFELFDSDIDEYAVIAAKFLLNVLENYTEKEIMDGLMENIDVEEMQRVINNYLDADDDEVRYPFERLDLIINPEQNSSDDFFFNI